MCEERREAEESLQEKWKKIEEFDARRLELEAIYTALLRANMVLAFCDLIQNSREECFEFANLDGIYVGEERHRTIYTLWKVII